MTYGYDAYTYSTGYRTSMSDGSGSTIWRHDPRGRLRMEEKTITGSGTFITEWSYNSADLAAWMRYPADNNGVQGETVTFTYVPQMLVKSAVGSTTYVKNATYDAAGRTDILELGLNGSQSYMYLDYNYYAWNVHGGRLQWLQAVQTNGSALRQKLEYAYDSAGNVDWIKDYLAGSPYQTQDFTYDLLNRLDAASAAGGDGQGLYNENYDYDAQGNLWKKGTVGSETVYTYLDSNHKHAVTHLGGTPMYSYDPNGNMTTRKVGATTYTQGWDAENRLVSVSGTGVSASFSYDGDGMRVKGTVNGTVTAYVGSSFEWTGSTSTMKKYYYAGAQRIAMRTGSGTGTSGLLWMVGDHLGSTTKIANADGSINSQRRYRPWGEVRFGGALPTTYRYTGQRQEDLLGGTDGLYYYGARWYDAALGRWLSPDSIIPEAAQGVQAWSRYTYVNNAPTRYRDPTGHSVDCGVAKLGCEAGRSKLNGREPRSPYPPGSGAPGFQIQFTLALGLPTDAHRLNSEPVSPLLFFGLSFVMDDDQGFQIYGLDRNIEFKPTLEQGAGELANPTKLLAAGITISGGPIFGSGFEEKGTDAYEGLASDTVFGYGPISIDKYVYLDPQTGKPDPEYLTGYDLGYSWGFPASVGTVVTEAHPWIRRQGPQYNPND